MESIVAYWSTLLGWEWGKREGGGEERGCEGVDKANVLIYGDHKFVVGQGGNVLGKNITIILIGGGTVTLNFGFTPQTSVPPPISTA